MQAFITAQPRQQSFEVVIHWNSDHKGVASHTEISRRFTHVRQR